jgi:hypothetical protein
VKSEMERVWNEWHDKHEFIEEELNEVKGRA